jgi:hypothetical protein
VVLLIGWGLVIAAWLTWLAARIAAALTGRHVPTFGGHWIISLARWRTSQAWPGTPTALVLLIAIALVCAAITVVILTRRVVAAHPGDPVAALAVNPQIKSAIEIPARLAPGEGWGAGGGEGPESQCRNSRPLMVTRSPSAGTAAVQPSSWSSRSRRAAAAEGSPWTT